MSWKFILYDWGGLNVTLFQAINAGTPGVLGPLAGSFSLVGNYWTAPLMLLGLWWWSKSATTAARVRAVRVQLVRFGAAFLLALLVATVLKLWLDFPRPPAVLGDLVHVIGKIELQYSLPSGHATYSALVVGALWPLLGWRGRIGVLLYAALVGWSRIAAGMHFPADVLAGWSLGGTCTVVAVWLTRRSALVLRAWRKTDATPAWIGYAIAMCAFIADQLAKLIISHTFTYGEQVEITPVFSLVHVLNPGAAFSLLAGAGGWQRYLFIALGLAAAAWLWRRLQLRQPFLEALGLSLILGGALGNVADRVLRGQVVDFLDFHWRHVHWPAFNFADLAITLGVALVVTHEVNLSSRRRQFKR